MKVQVLLQSDGRIRYDDYDYEIRKTVGDKVIELLKGRG